MVYQYGNSLRVRETDIDDGIADMPLQDYIRLVADVAVDLQTGPPANLSMRNRFDSFLDVGAAKTNDRSLEGDDRYRAMQSACMQSWIRHRDGQGQFARPLLM